ncbi:MAG: hypothetical protein AB1505_04665 [Candidatus Latescibacterota bacterium]
MDAPRHVREAQFHDRAFGQGTRAAASRLIGVLELSDPRPGVAQGG